MIRVIIDARKSATAEAYAKAGLIAQAIEITEEMEEADQADSAWAAIAIAQAKAATKLLTPTEPTSFSSSIASTTVLFAGLPPSASAWARAINARTRSLDDRGNLSTMLLLKKPARLLRLYPQISKALKR